MGALFSAAAEASEAEIVAEMIGRATMLEWEVEDGQTRIGRRQQNIR